MAQAKKEICYDPQLQIEAYTFTGVSQNFPNHFHDYYVIGLVEAGDRRLVVNQQEYTIEPGDLLTFNPYDKHSCEELAASRLTYRCFNIQKEKMQQIMREIGAEEELPHFLAPVQKQASNSEAFINLHQLVMAEQNDHEKEALFYLLMEELLQNFTSMNRVTAPAAKQEVEAVCRYLEEHYGEKITLDQLSEIAHLNKHSLVRNFTRYKGITPYRYLETLRIDQAKKLLEQGESLLSAAQQTGFYDQSHFTNYFNRLIGLTPSQYQSIFLKMKDSEEQHEK
ncbi:AraC family ligand binding domain-containing protein [Enterococcus sp. 669A]|uniref:AraC family ligand binding domain-containing protein n=1 Tax=Candidatus Enterococcus moelleringii TaxID=2815325 RepID=A0ABS3LEX6_9ENTE|nr:AraC family transcriptional regulator [Enterococcus sp. 669A]MBO1307578.1 AraC family ligand binding domain-containing protein [Enterococcus sp. 669A]